MFTLIVTLLFKAAGDMGEAHNSNDYARYQELSSNYDRLGNYSTNPSGFVRAIKNHTDKGVFSTYNPIANPENPNITIPPMPVKNKIIINEGLAIPKPAKSRGI